MATKKVLITKSPGDPGVLVIRRNIDGYFRDAEDGVFRAVPTTKYVVPTQSSGLPGVYSWSTDDVWEDGIYQALWYADAGLSGTPKMFGLELLNDEMTGGNVNATVDLTSVTRMLRNIMARL